MILVCVRITGSDGAWLQRPRCVSMARPLERPPNASTRVCNDVTRPESSTPAHVRRLVQVTPWITPSFCVRRLGSPPARGSKNRSAALTLRNRAKASLPAIGRNRKAESPKTKPFRGRARSAPSSSLSPQTAAEDGTSDLARADNQRPAVMGPFNMAACTSATLARLLPTGK